MGTGGLPLFVEVVSWTFYQSDIPFKKVSLVILAPSSLCFYILPNSPLFSVFIQVVVACRSFLPHLLVYKPNLNTVLEETDGGRQKDFK